MNKVTLAYVRAALRAERVTIRKRDGEYRVNLLGAGEETASYTDDLRDAWETGLALAAWDRRQRGA